MITHVPATWGESDTPLLPRELERPLKKLDQFFTVERSIKGRNKVSHFNYATLARNFNWRKHLTSEELLQMLLGLDPLLRNEKFERWLDFPTLPKFQMGQNLDISNLGLLRRTHLNLKERNIDLQSLVPNLEYGSFLTILNLTDDFVSTLDLVTAARSQMEVPTTPQQSETLDELLIHLVRCILLEHGMDRASKNIDNIQTIIGLRMGFHNEGVHTLQATGDLVGLTRERVRGVFLQWTNVDAELDRVWPKPPILDLLLAQISPNPSWDDEQLKALLETEFHVYWKSPCQTISNILHKFEVTPSLALLNKNELVPANSARGKFDFPSMQVIRRSILHSGAKSCFSLIDDVVDDLSTGFPDIPEDELRQIIRDNAVYGNLPLDYVFASGQREQISPVSRALLMLAWAGELSIDDIRAGLGRYGRFRKMPPPPPREVLRAFYKLRSEFSVDGDLVRATIPTNRSEETVEGKIALLCEQQDGMVISKALVQDHFRRLGRYTSSASLYMSFSPILRPAGVGCITLVGHNPTAEEIDAARQLGNNLTIESNISWHSDLSTPMMEIFVGTAFRDSGVISISGQKARWLEGRRLRVLSDELDEHGTLSVSGNFLYGFSSFFNAKQIDTGDTIQVELDTKEEVARIHVNEFISNFE